MGPGADNRLVAAQGGVQVDDLQRHTAQHQADAVPEREDHGQLPGLHEPLEQPALLAANVGAWRRRSTTNAPTATSLP